MPLIPFQFVCSSYSNVACTRTKRAQANEIPNVLYGK